MSVHYTLDITRLPYYRFVTLLITILPLSPSSLSTPHHTAFLKSNSMLPQIPIPTSPNRHAFFNLSQYTPNALLSFRTISPPTLIIHAFDAHRCHSCPLSQQPRLELLPCIRCPALPFMPLSRYHAHRYRTRASSLQVIPAILPVDWTLCETWKSDVSRGHDATAAQRRGAVRGGVPRGEASVARSADTIVVFCLICTPYVWVLTYTGMQARTGAAWDLWVAKTQGDRVYGFGAILLSHMHSVYPSRV